MFRAGGYNEKQDYRTDYSPSGFINSRGFRLAVREGLPGIR